VNVDFETYSDLDLQEVGLQRYARHPSTRVILATVRHSDGHYSTYDERDPDGLEDGGIPFASLISYLKQAEEIHAWNAPFEYAICTHTLKLDIPLERFHCTMAHALYRSLPASLDDTAKIIGIEGKVSFSARLMALFCKPRKKNTKEGPTDWASFRRYNIHDVEMEYAAQQALRDLPWPRTERVVWLENEKINLQGVPVDVERAEAAWWLFNELVAQANGRVQEITGVENPNSVQQLTAWLKSRGVRTPSLDKDHIKKLLALDLPADVREVLKLRQGAAMTAPKKFDVALRQHLGGWMCNMVQYSGAGRTHRFAGRGLQPHNMRRGPKKDTYIASTWEIVLDAFKAKEPGYFSCLFADPFTALADMIRSMIRDPDGHDLVVADYSSIEVVVLWWVAGAERLMQTFREGKDPYKVFAVTLFGVAYEDVTPEQRTEAKPPVLGGGYGLGKATLVDYAENMGIKLTPEQAERAVKAYRRDHPEVVRAWGGIESAMRKTIETGQPHKFGHVTFLKRGPHVLCRLPSGAEITYWKARMVPGGYWDDGALKEPKIAYDGVHQDTHQWTEIVTWGGKLIENIVQSIARDVLIYGLLRALRAGIPVFLHVHDEIVARTRGHAEEVMKLLEECMSPPPWITTCPVQAHPFRCPAYRKD